MFPFIGKHAPMFKDEALGQLTLYKDLRTRQPPQTPLNIKPLRHTMMPEPPSPGFKIVSGVENIIRGMVGSTG